MGRALEVSREGGMGKEVLLAVKFPRIDIYSGCAEDSTDLFELVGIACDKD